jgi:LmbE family N-acetylglucosaminyl deacetylase
VVAHPDDETFGCGSLLLAAGEQGWHTVVACATRGEAGEATPGTDPERALGDIREAELRAAAELLGVSEVQVLGFADSGMAGAAPADSLLAASAERVVAAVRSVIELTRPDVVVTLDASDGHRDHAVIRDAVLATARDQELPVYLHCLARSLMDRWVEHMSSAQPELVYLREVELGTPDDEITLVIETTAHYDARERAIAAHASQSSPYDGLPGDLRRAFLTREHLIRVEPTPG